MIIVFPYSPKDQDLAANLSAWITELGPNKGHKAIVCRDARTNPNIDREVKHNLSQVFDSVDSVDVVERMDSDWSAESNTSARAANIMFRTAAKHIQFTDPQPWLWLEPDVVILKPGWMDEVVKAYNAEPQKPFMGDFVNFPGVPPHMSGIAVYPGIVVDHAPWATMASTQDTAWDVYAADQIVPKMKQTHLIKHQWKFGGISNESELDNLLGQCGDAVIFHQDKSGTVIKFLRERKQIAAGTDRTDRSQSLNHSSTVLAGLTPARRATTTDIFIKTYPKDEPWLEYCLLSIRKFADGFRKNLVLSPGGMPSFAVGTKFAGWASFRQFPEHGNDAYLSQQVFKMYADTYTDADYITHLDSDTIFVRPVTPETYFKDGKPVWMYTPIDQAHPNESHAWRSVMEKFMGKKADFEFMRRFPFVIPRWAYQALRDFCKEKHGMELKDYIMSQPYRQFSEFNCMGFYLYEYHYDKFSWVNTARPESEWPVLTVDQRWSVGGLTDEIKQKWEEILSETSPPDAKAMARKESSLAAGVAPFGIAQTPLTGAETGQMGVETNSSSVEIAPKADSCPGANDHPERLLKEVNGTQTLSNMEEVRRSVEALSRYASDGFARMRVIKELKRVKLVPKKK